MSCGSPNRRRIISISEGLSHDHTEIDVLIDDTLIRLEADDATSGFDSLDLVWARLAVHIRAEHLHLFPAALKISEREGVSDIRQTLERLRRDHDFFMHELAASIKAMRSMTAESEAEIRGEAARVLRSIRDRLIEHNAIEE